MASCLTDDERERRYIVLRKKKRRCDFLCGIPALIAISFAVVLVLSIIYAIRDIMTGSGYGTLLQMLLSLIAAGVTAYTAYTRHLKYILAAGGVLLFLGIISANAVPFFMVVLLCPAALGAYFWGQLEEEEGFPLFRISYEEMSERKRNAEKKTRVRAELSGSRRPAGAAVHSAMGDLLDDRENTPVLTAALHGYHERSGQAVGGFNEPAGAAGEHGKMEEL